MNHTKLFAKVGRELSVAMFGAALGIWWFRQPAKQACVAGTVFAPQPTACTNYATMTTDAVTGLLVVAAVLIIAVMVAESKLKEATTN